MHVLVATTRTQGQEPDDFDHAAPGELVRFPLAECDDPACGCTRAFAGLDSARATTTAEVVDRPDLGPAALWDLLRDDAVRGVGPDGLSTLDLVLLTADLLELVDSAAALPVGTVIGRHEQGIVVRADERTARPDG